jgi:hypothetical protein
MGLQELALGVGEALDRISHGRPIVAASSAATLTLICVHSNAGHFDVLIVGAGLSGIGAACHLRRDAPDLSFVLLEARDAIGGTWDLFRYPGIRSDSDMHTLGYSFSPWRES